MIFTRIIFHILFFSSFFQAFEKLYVDFLFVVWKFACACSMEEGENWVESGVFQIWVSLFFRVYIYFFSNVLFKCVCYMQLKPFQKINFLLYIRTFFHFFTRIRGISTFLFCFFSTNDCDMYIWWWYFFAGLFVFFMRFISIFFVNW